MQLHLTKAPIGAFIVIFIVHLTTPFVKSFCLESQEGWQRENTVKTMQMFAEV